MEPPPRRKRFQIHLSTAVVMMIAAGFLIWANVTKREIDRLAYAFGDPLELYGWPADAVSRINNVGVIGEDTFPLVYDRTRLAIDGAVFAGILVAVWFACEWWIRRRARKGT